MRMAEDGAAWGSLRMASREDGAATGWRRARKAPREDGAA